VVDEFVGVFIGAVVGEFVIVLEGDMVTIVVARSSNFILKSGCATSYPGSTVAACK
jgi:hypothetical protein